MIIKLRGDQEKNYKLLTTISYIIYGLIWCVILAFVMQNVRYGIYKSFINYYGMLGSLCCVIVVIMVFLFPIYLHKLVKTSWKVPIISIAVTVIIAIVWFLMLLIAVTAK
jgi:hypothetical protein